MSFLRLNKGAAPPTPGSGKSDAYLDSTDPVRWKARMDDAVTQILSPNMRPNLLLNGGFGLAQRQALTSVTTYSSVGGRVYGPDRWWLSNENASVDYAAVDTAAAVETGLLSRYYGRIRKITALGKFAVGQVVEGVDSFRLRGRTVRFQCWMKRTPSAMTVRLGLVALSSAGTIDTVTSAGGAFITAWGAPSTDPTLGTNLSRVTPSTADGGTLSGSGVTCIVTASWVRFGGTFVVPAGTLNLLPMLWTDGQPAINDQLHIAQAGLYDGEEVQDWAPVTPAEELSRCQRFYAKTFALGTAPAQNVGVDTGALRFVATVAGANPERGASWRYPVAMRATPTVTLYNPAAANAQARDETAAADCSATTTIGATDSSIGLGMTGAAGTAVGNLLTVHATADAEL